MKITLLGCLLLIITHATGQIGYVILNDGEKLQGYLKPYKSPANFETGIECRKDKKDKSPIRISLSKIYEYSINNKTKRVLQDFKPFADRNIYFGLIEADLVSKGKIDLLRVPLQKVGYSLPFIYIAEDSLNYLTALPNTNKLNDVLPQIIPENYLRKYVALHSNKFYYADIPELILAFNSDSYYIRLKLDQAILLQVMDLIDKASELFDLNYSEIRKKPDIIIGNVWKKIGEGELKDSLFTKYQSFEIASGALTLFTDKSDKITEIQFFPKKNVTKRELESFLNLAYKRERVIEAQSGNPKLGLAIDEIKGLHYLLIVNLESIE